MARSAPRGTGDVVTVAELVSRADTVALRREPGDTAPLDLGEIEAKHRRADEETLAVASVAAFAEPEPQPAPRPARRRAAVAAGLFVVLGVAVFAFSSGGTVNGTPQPVVGATEAAPPPSSSSSPPVAVATLTAVPTPSARADLNDRGVTTERKQPDAGGRKPAQPPTTDYLAPIRSAVESEINKWPHG
ncbi:hypothetical protein [Amycolatopsis sp. H20-H5]|uniref:hypothetical protein n=1 Tax=Amycolatopsis sp. H20-H5 TaxID=3046309 RepID=UPI002DBCFB24|nr:hypothetical protein [Amycolatopsis sp. H20-H5]MEC3978414.1 hypothetical protein [Amycolatopsis sp. H20-H5]